jgi:glycosyltransferase involved in cell wall biosynthesis
MTFLGQLLIEIYVSVMKTAARPSCGLTWSLVIATYNRPNVLQVAIALALRQSRPPAQLIVVDASDNWLHTRDQVLALPEVKATSTSIEYLAATDKSLARQRNQGLLLANGDIVFFIDDDSLMFPDCAEQIMSIYEKDVSCSVAGVQAELSSEIPAGVGPKEDQKVTGSQRKARLYNKLFRRSAHWIWRNVFLMDNTKLFIPYDGAYHSRQMPQYLMQDNVRQEVLLGGCRMTFRRSVILREKFDSLMLGYCPTEDLDASYRVSRHGVLLTATKAVLHHYESAGGRTNRYNVSMLTTMNQAMCLRRHSQQLNLRIFDFWILMLRKVVAELLKDALSHRWDLPQVRGLLNAVKVSHTIFHLSLDHLEQVYPNLQKRVLNGLPPL